jgi:hypothetical protein
MNDLTGRVTRWQRVFLGIAAKQTKSRQTQIPQYTAKPNEIVQEESINLKAIEKLNKGLIERINEVTDKGRAKGVQVVQPLQPLYEKREL